MISSVNTRTSQAEKPVLQKFYNRDDRRQWVASIKKGVKAILRAEDTPGEPLAYVNGGWSALTRIGRTKSGGDGEKA